MLIFGLKVTALGLGTVFVALVALMFIIDLQSKILAPKPKKVEEPKKEVAVPKEEDASVKIEEDENELVAVIAAAIQAFSGQQVIVRTITRVPGSSGAIWSSSGRTDIMNLRQL